MAICKQMYDQRSPEKLSKVMKVKKSQIKILLKLDRGRQADEVL